ncbi:Protein cms1 [Malassezia vespertilionis]|uniref:Protein cms1 n=1 Tax=Malassezia vespertilionis TaxID=2020962 RepID=UPI0024B04145|nr:Protein cms1 [Malassezia vespertilionis]WFD07158.1 Protein cms1 [Malassezia vespertilionis]
MGDELDDGLLLEGDVAYTDDATPSGNKRGHAEDVSESKKRKRREKRHKKSAVYHANVAAEKSITAQSAEMQADFLAAQFRKTFPKLSALEVQDTLVPASAVKETFTFDAPRTLEHMADYLAQSDASKPWMKEHGAPCILVVSGNAQRAAGIARTLRALLPHEQAKKSDAPTVAKLFARHFKVDEHVALLQSHATPLAVGTPHRLQQLLDRGALQIAHTCAVVLDHSWTDAKSRTIFDTPETRDALIHLLGHSPLRDAFRRAQPCRLLLF